VTVREFSESDVENAALEWLRAIGWQVAHGPDIAPGMPATERADYGKVVLARRLREALAGYSAPDQARPLSGMDGPWLLCSWR
jgi:type I restriction enzyme R subunit